MKQTGLSLLFFLSLRLNASQASDFQALLDSTYAFEPQKLEEKQREEKAKAMDEVWSEVDKDPKAYLPLLRKQLAEGARSDYFLVDGPNLLLKHSTDLADKKLALAAMLRAKLEWIDSSAYFNMVHNLACQGLNVFAAAEKLLEEKDFKVFVPEHALTLGADEAFLYLVLPMEEPLYKQALLARLAAERDPERLKVLVLATAHLVSEDSQKALKTLEDSTKDRAVRKLCKKYGSLENKKGLRSRKLKLQHEGLEKLLKAYVDRSIYDSETDQKLIEEMPYVVRKADFGLIQNLRQKQACRVSDEALAEIGFLTELMQYSLTSED